MNRIPSDVEDLWIANFEIAKQKNLILNQQQSIKNLTIGIMRGGMIGGSGRLRVTNCSNLISIDMSEYALMKYKNLELTNLPMLQEISFGNIVFQIIQTILMESSRKREVTNQICLHFSRFNWETTHFKEIVVINAR